MNEILVKLAIRQFSRKGYGPVAQLGERCVRNAEVRGSIPLRSTASSSMQATPTGVAHQRIPRVQGGFLRFHPL